MKWYVSRSSRFFMTFVVGLVLMAATLTILVPRVFAAPLPAHPVVSSVIAPSTVQMLHEKARTSWPWYISRAAGLVALALLFLLVLSGIGMYSGYTYRYIEPLEAWKVHRALGLSLGIAIFIHGFTLIFDTYVGFNFIQLLVPFASHYDDATLFGHQVGSLYIALGIISFYLAIIIIVSSLLWQQSKPRMWRWLHTLAYVLAIFVLIHAFYMGTRLYTGSDLKTGLIRYLWLGAVILIVVGIVSRLKHIRTVRK